jgi:hypothetical protein
VLHFVHNPETEARREADTAQISQLQAEAAALRAELAVLKSGASASDPTAPATAVAAAEKTLLERKVCMQRFDQENIGRQTILCSADMAADLVQDALRVCRIAMASGSGFADPVKDVFISSHAECCMSLGSMSSCILVQQFVLGSRMSQR